MIERNPEFLKNAEIPAVVRVFAPHDEAMQSLYRLNGSKFMEAVGIALNNTANASQQRDVEVFVTAIYDKKGIYDEEFTPGAETEDVGAVILRVTVDEHRKPRRIIRESKVPSDVAYAIDLANRMYT